MLIINTNKQTNNASELMRQCDESDNNDKQQRSGKQVTIHCPHIIFSVYSACTEHTKHRVTGVNITTVEQRQRQMANTRRKRKRESNTEKRVKKGRWLSMLTISHHSQCIKVEVTRK